ncbi:MAG: cupin domain-containing protein [Verrucomicrobiales bacterium]|nr:cupin domain-containing protein [Verrucomicrobiales bacterium]
MAEQPLIQASEVRCIALPEETRFEPNGIVSRTLLRTPGARAVLFGFAEGQELTEHSAPYHALVQALEGQCEFTVNGQVHVLKPGDWLSMPPQAPHALKAITRFSMLLILIPPAVAVLGRA